MITIYTSPAYCPHCKQAKEYFKNRNIDFIEIVVNTSEKKEELLNISGRLAVPVIKIGEKIFLGWNEDEIPKGIEEYF